MAKCENQGCKKDTEELFVHMWNNAEGMVSEILLCKKCFTGALLLAKNHSKITYNRGNSKYGGTFFK